MNAAPTTPIEDLVGWRAVAIAGLNAWLLIGVFRSWLA